MMSNIWHYREQTETIPRVRNEELKLKLHAFATMIMLGASQASVASDFYILPDECRMLLVTLDDGDMKYAAGDPPSYGCRRRGQELDCVVHYASGGKSPSGYKETFRVLVDSPPYLFFGSENGATLFSVNLNTRKVGFTARLTDANYVGEKVCSATYTTGQEVELYKESRH
jgi:hypothetical protein